MRFPARWLVTAIVLTLLATPLSLLAQEDSGITVVGSAIASRLFEAAASESSVPFQSTPTGTARGITTFCRGEADITLANRPLSADEETNCDVVGVNYLELLLGYNVVAFVGNPSDQLNTCLTNDTLNALYIVSAAGQIVNWNQLDVANPDLPITLVVASQPAVTQLLDNLVEGDGVRGDIVYVDDSAAVLDQVRQTPGALGIVAYQAGLEGISSARVFQVNSGSAGCTLPSAENADGRAYAASERLFAYVNASSLSKPGMSDLLAGITADSAAAAVASVGFVPPIEASQALNQAIVSHGTTGRQFTKYVTAFTIPPALSGAVTLAGSASGYNYIQSLTTALSTAYPGLTTTFIAEGEPDGFRRFCNGEVEIAVAFSDLTPEQQDNCAANNIVPVTIELGSLAVVVMASQQSSYLTCLTTADLGSAWRASDTAVETWDQIKPQFPSTPITLFASERTDIFADILLGQTAGAGAVMRADVETSTDAFYRAAATANVDGAMTYASWSVYQSILRRDQANLMPVQVDAGAGCVAPDEAAIRDHTYPLMRTIKLMVNQAALTRTDVQSFLWFAFSDEQYPLFGQSSLIAPSFAGLLARRDALQAAFDAASEAARRAAAQPNVTEEESTPEPESDATPEAGS